MIETILTNAADHHAAVAAALVALSMLAFIALTADLITEATGGYDCRRARRNRNRIERQARAKARRKRHLRRRRLFI